LRPAEGKWNAVVLDHAGAVFRHGFVEDSVEWTLDPERQAQSPIHAARLQGGYRSRMVECSQCHAIRLAGEACRHCGFMPQRSADAIVFAEGELAAVDRKQRKATSLANPDERIRWHGMLTAIAAERGYKSGWVAHKFREKFNTWPAVRTMTPIPPTPECKAWVRSRAIAFAKAREKAA
jgi:hypothetical protein